MSRIGKNPITIPSGVEATFAEGVLKIKGPKGELTRAIPQEVSVAVEGGVVTITKKDESDAARALWGTTAAHVKNMIEGVANGFKKELEIEGVGYRAEASGNKIKLHVGFSHPVELTAPEGITVTAEKGHITVSGINKDAVGQFAADVRAVKKPEPYKGKGIHYVGEYIIRKQGKKAVT